MTLRWSSQSALLACLIALGCGDEQAGSPEDAGYSEDAGHVHDDAGRDAPCSTDIPAFEPGLTVVGNDGLISVRLVSAVPRIPQVYDNDWEVEFIDASGALIDDIKVSRVEPFMPVHGHPGNYDATIVPRSEAGRVSLERVNLKMNGPWEVRMTVSSARVGGDFIVMNVCVPKK
jgi:hypothetical protein